mmetsp:Transcript_32045/g.48402  ORF Transcript_32045/g.48402 Transcript_32045/m.48402 type:complete len:345 (+) Transcript_32045:111-1145(+)
MSFSRSNVVVTSLALIAVAVSIRPLFRTAMKLQSTSLDPDVGEIPVLTEGEIARRVAKKKIVLVGGTRGVGFGTALTLAKAGAEVMIVGRSKSSGTKAVDFIREQLPSSSNHDKVSYVTGDIGTVSSAKRLIEKLEKSPTRYDCLVVSAATFPDWSQSLQNEDGVEKSFGIAVVGRFLLYHNLSRFMNNDVRVLNVLAGGTKFGPRFNKDIATGHRDPSFLFESMLTFAIGNDIMLEMLQRRELDVKKNATFVSTHPGIIKTDLHRGQGIWFDAFESFMVMLNGISEETAGIRQTSILLSDELKLHSVSRVDSFMLGRVKDDNNGIEEHGEWIWEFLTKLEKEK